MKFSSLFGIEKAGNYKGENCGYGSYYNYVQGVQDKEQGLGAADYITKPIDRDELPDRIKNILNITNRQS